MPLPKTRDVGKVMKVLNKEGGRPRAQKVAIALSVARKSGADIPKKRKNPMNIGPNPFRKKSYTQD